MVADSVADEIRGPRLRVIAYNFKAYPWLNMAVELPSVLVPPIEGQSRPFCGVLVVDIAIITEFSNSAVRGLFLVMMLQNKLRNTSAVRVVPLIALPIFASMMFYLWLNLSLWDHAIATTVGVVGASSTLLVLVMWPVESSVVSAAARCAREYAGQDDLSEAMLALTRTGASRSIRRFARNFHRIMENAEHLTR